MSTGLSIEHGIPSRKTSVDGECLRDCNIPYAKAQASREAAKAATAIAGVTSFTPTSFQSPKPWKKPLAWPVAVRQGGVRSRYTREASLSNK